MYCITNKYCIFGFNFEVEERWLISPFDQTFMMKNVCLTLLQQIFYSKLS